ncbi:ligand-binding sensor domain-containing protein [Nemorincola caseinilytica]
MRSIFSVAICLSISFVCASGNAWANVPGLITTGDTVKAIDTSAWYVFQDRNNNYWFGSDGNGVYRYDGTHTIHYFTGNGLCNDRVRGIQGDSLGNVYINTCNGISRYDGRTLTTLKAIPADRLPDAGWRLHTGDLWFAGPQDSGVVYRYDGSTLYRLRFPKLKVAEDFIATHPRERFPAMVFNPYDVYSIYRDRRGHLWFGTGMLGVCRYDGNTFAWIPEDELGLSAIAYGVRATIEDRQGRFWFSNTMHRFLIHRNANGTIGYTMEKGIGDADAQHPAGHSYFMSALEDKNGDIWMVTYNEGIWRYNGNSMTRYDIKSKGKNATTFTIYKDRQGRLWVGTHAAGPYLFNGKTFEPFTL